MFFKYRFYGHERSTCSRTDFTWKKVSKETNKDGTNRDQIKIKIDDKRSSFDNIHCHDRFSRSSHEQDKNTQVILEFCRLTKVANLNIETHLSFHSC